MVSHYHVLHPARKLFDVLQRKKNFFVSKLPADSLMDSSFDIIDGRCRSQNQRLLKEASRSVREKGEMATVVGKELPPLPGYCQM